jgi:hypothetical protein
MPDLEHAMRHFEPFERAPFFPAEWRSSQGNGIMTQW